MPRQPQTGNVRSTEGQDLDLNQRAVAFFVCTFGLISYLVVDVVVNDVFYGMITFPFLFLAFTVVVFGWWLSNEIVGPIEKVTLLSKSLERTASTTIPKSFGASRN